MGSTPLKQISKEIDIRWEDLADYMPQTESAREQCLFWYERAADGGEAGVAAH